MKRQKTPRQIKSTEELWQVLQDALNNLPAKYLKNCAKVYREELALA